MDSLKTIEVGDEIETRSGRRYSVVKARVQEKGKHQGRQHLRCVVLAPDAYRDPDITVHICWWYSR